MKSFFKKIALMLALVMVVTMLPARAASAADDDGPQMYPTLKFYLGGDETGKYSDDARYAKTWNKDGYDVVGQFVSSDPEVATVNRRGLVTPVKVGTATITATFKSTTGGEDVVRECKVTVKKNAVKAGISDNSAAALEKGVEVGGTFQTVTYREDADGNRVWKGTDVITSPARFESSNPEIFTVTKKGGYIKGVAVGEATLRVWAVQSEGRLKNEDGSWGEYRPVTDKAEYTVKVVAPGPDVVEYDRAKLTVGNNELEANGASGTLVTFTLYSGPDQIDTETKDVQVRFETTRGTFGFNDVTLENGTATVLYTTPILTSEAVARITATIISAEATPEGQALINIQAAPVDITLKPQTGTSTIVDATGANVLGSTVQEADRITMHFNKSVKAEDFMWLVNGKYVMTKDDAVGGDYKFTLRIDDNVPQTQDSVGYNYEFSERDIVNVIQNTDTSLTFVLTENRVKSSTSTSTDNCMVFTDNSKYVLDFVDRRYNGVVTSTGIIGYVTDAILPSMMSVAQFQGKSLTQVVITFSEPIPKFDVDHVAIDGVSLGGDYAGDKWGVASDKNKCATVSRLGGTENSTRNAYLITLGRDAQDKQIYFTAGRHSLTVNNVGDYAYWTDASNRIATATLDFTIVANDVVPSYTVEVQSPEQYLVRFNCQVDGDLFKNGDSKTGNTVLKLQYYNTNTNQWADVAGLGQYYSIVNVTGNSSETLAKVEVQKDWTQVLNNVNYYNYDFRIRAEKGAITNVANGKTNEEINFELTDAKMKTVDAVSPSIVGEVREVSTGTKFEVTFDEPIQFTKDGENPGVNDAGNITPSKAQGRTGVPVITAQVVAKDLTKTVDAKIAGIDPQNFTLTIETAVALDPGKEYILYVRSVSDDIGNTSLTLSKEFTTIGSAATPVKFQIAGVWADAALDTKGIYELTEVGQDDKNDLDALYVEFTSPFATSGGVKTVLTNTNWSINGYPLPAGSYIIGNIVGDSRLNGVTIVLPHGTITDIKATVVTLSTNVEDIYGNRLEEPNRVVTQYPVAVKGVGSNSELAQWPGYLGKIGKFAVADQNNQFDFDIPGIKLCNTLKELLEGKRAAVPFAASSSGESVKIEETSTGTAVTVDINPTITSDKIMVNGERVSVVKGYSIVLYGIKLNDKGEVSDEKQLTDKEIIIDANANGGIDMKTLITVGEKDIQKTYDCFKLVITAKSRTEGGDSAPCEKYTKFEPK